MPETDEEEHKTCDATIFLFFKTENINIMNSRVCLYYNFVQIITNNILFKVTGLHEF